MPDFLQSLLQTVRESPVGIGARGTLDALQQDVGAMGRGQLPPQAMRALEQVISAYPGAGGVSQAGVMLPRIPKFVSLRSTMDPGQVGKFLDLDKKLVELGGKSGLHQLEQAVPSGEYDTVLGTLLSGRGLGKVGEGVTKLRGLVNEMAEDAFRGSSLSRAAKSMRPGVSKISGFARPGAQPTVQRYEQMLAAVGDPKTGQVIHEMQTYRPGAHGGLSTIASVTKGMENAVEGFVDPKTFDFFSRADIEKWLAGRR